MEESSIVYGCAQSYLSSLEEQHCGYLSSKIPDCGFSDAACCTTVYDFVAEEAKCLSPFAACMDFTAWTSDASKGLSACTADLTSPTITDSTAVSTGESKPTTTKGTVSPTITQGPTVTGSGSAVNTQSTTTKSTGGRIEMNLYGVGIIGLLCLSAFMGTLVHVTLNRSCKAEHTNGPRISHDPAFDSSESIWGGCTRSA
ncbi:hypothetical protein VTL71DRAFT_13084 [Oculimacula yallundae]|uniref:Uncharacterized protein n=1 Tax=Oculimacula yallundae TaxID=86028 RepID=A0ABR4CPU2_9HELO